MRHHYTGVPASIPTRAVLAWPGLAGSAPGPVACWARALACVHLPQVAACALPATRNPLAPAPPLCVQVTSKFPSRAAKLIVVRPSTNQGEECTALGFEMPKKFAVVYGLIWDRSTWCALLKGTACLFARGSRSQCQSGQEAHVISPCPPGPLLLQACADGGSVSDEALSQLASADYTETVKMEGGYAGWTQVGAGSVGMAACHPGGMAACCSAGSLGALPEPSDGSMVDVGRAGGAGTIVVVGRAMPYRTSGCRQAARKLCVHACPSPPPPLSLSPTHACAFPPPCTCHSFACCATAGVGAERQAAAAPRALGFHREGGPQVGAQHPRRGGELRRGGEPHQPALRQGL